MKVLIIGAGPTGLTAALEFIQQGIIPEIVDVKKSPSPLSRAVGILPESIEKLKASGVGDKILKEGVKFNKIKIHNSSKLLLDLNMLKIVGPNNLLIGLPQDRTEFIMSEALKEKGVIVKYDHKVSKVSTDDKKATAMFSDGQVKEYDWIIGADGVNSITRESLEIKYVGYELPEDWSIADVVLEKEYDKETFGAWLLDGLKKDILVMVPLGEKRVRLVSSTPDSIKAMPIDLGIKHINRTGTFKISIKQSEAYVKGRVLLAGDSAHTHSPVGGRGMNLGIDDAIEAVRSIMEDKTQEYNIDRQKIGSRIIRDTEKMRKLLVSKNFFIRLFIKIILFLVQHTVLKKYFLRNMVKL